jgi:hypothetical protein
LAADGVLCAELISRWCARSSTALQQSLVGPLVAPQQPQHVAPLHAALLSATLPPHTLFSYLSKVTALQHIVSSPKINKFFQKYVNLGPFAGNCQM